jgi:hypothetical protein
MRIAGAFLSTRSEVHDSLLYVMGGFPEWWTIPDLPAVQEVPLTLVLDLDADEIDRR